MANAFLICSWFFAVCIFMATLSTTLVLWKDYDTYVPLVDAQCHWVIKKWHEEERHNKANCTCAAACTSGAYCRKLDACCASRSATTLACEIEGYETCADAVSVAVDAVAVLCYDGPDGLCSEEVAKSCPEVTGECLKGLLRDERCLVDIRERLISPYDPNRLTKDGDDPQVWAKFMLFAVSLVLLPFSSLAVAVAIFDTAMRCKERTRDTAAATSRLTIERNTA
jgi:hypothetical protein